MIPSLAIKAFKGTWSGAGTYFRGDVVKGSNDSFYKATADGGQAEDPVADTNNTFWERSSSNMMDATASASLYLTINETVDKLNLLIEHVRSKEGR